jgi:methyltransferase (TIGR00027 family)
MAVRTRFLDELLSGVLAGDAITTVLSVGCGLDTRPWRLDLPAELHWIEVDFPDVLDYKYGLLADEKSHCHVERLSVDLNEPVQRQTMYDKAGNRALMITEGVLMYLPAGTVRALAAECGRIPALPIGSVTSPPIPSTRHSRVGRKETISGMFKPRMRLLESRFSTFCAVMAGRQPRCAAT